MAPRPTQILRNPWLLAFIASFMIAIVHAACLMKTEHGIGWHLAQALVATEFRQCEEYFRLPDFRIDLELGFALSLTPFCSAIATVAAQVGLSALKRGRLTATIALAITFSVWTSLIYIAGLLPHFILLYAGPCGHR